MSNKNMIRWCRAGLVLATVGTTLGCGERDEIWDAHIDGNVVALGLTNAAAIIDAPANRALLLPVNGDKSLAPTSLSIGKSFAAAKTTVDGSRLMVLSLGIVPVALPRTKGRR